MNSIIKQIINIVDDKEIEIHSINPVYKEMVEINSFNSVFQQVTEDADFELDCVYLVYKKDDNVLLFPIINEKIETEFILEMSKQEINNILNYYQELKKQVNSL